MEYSGRLAAPDGAAILIQLQDQEVDLKQYAAASSFRVQTSHNLPGLILLYALHIQRKSEGAMTFGFLNAHKLSTWH
jgi:hypothetical protein